MTAVEEDLYTVLGVARTASQAEIRAGYLRAVRQHPPDRDAAGFSRVQHAYEVLKDPKTRAEYDKTLRAGPEAQTLLEAGRRALEASRAAEAVALFKRALARQPAEPAIRDLLAQALLAQKQYEEAEKQARQVLALEPENPTYSLHVGDILVARDHDAEALPYYRKAVSLDPTSSLYVVKLAHLLNYLGQPDEAIKLVEQTLAGNGKADFDDLTYFQCLYSIFTLRERHGDAAATQRRIREILPPDAAQRSHAASYYFENAMRMEQLGYIEAAVLSIEEAAAIDANLPAAAETIARLRKARVAAAELNRLSDDKSFEFGLRMTCVVRATQNLFGATETRKQSFDKASTILLDELSTEGCNIGSQVLRLRTQYPAFALVVADLLDTIREQDAKVPKVYVLLTCPGCGQRGHTDRAAPSVQRLRRFTCGNCKTEFDGLSQRPGAAKPAGCFVVTATYGDPQASPALILRAYRDRVLAANGWGRLLIQVYGRVGPILARCIVVWPALRKVSRRVCELAAKRVERTVDLSS